MKFYTARTICPILIGILLFIYLPHVKSQSSEDKPTIVDTPFEKGKIKNGNKSGVWMYYDTPNELALKIDYTSGQLLFLKKRHH